MRRKELLLLRAGGALAVTGPHTFSSPLPRAPRRSAIYDPDCAFVDPTVSVRPRTRARRTACMGGRLRARRPGAPRMPFANAPLPTSPPPRTPPPQFSGLDLWKRNLALLTPFLIQPSLRLITLAPKAPAAGGGAAAMPAQLEATWALATWLALPWRPRIAIEGSTLFTLSAGRNTIVRHVESWCGARGARRAAGAPVFAPAFAPRPRRAPARARRDVTATEALLQLFRPTPGPPAA